MDPTLLIVEDNESNLKLLLAVLAGTEFRVLTASDAETGLELVREHRPDLVLMDVGLPGMDGLSAARIIGSDPELAGVPVVTLTAHAMDSDADLSLSAGCIGHLTKPVDTRAFASQVRGFIEAGRQQLARPVADHRGRVLVVDDEPLNIKLFKAKLATERYEVLTASSGAEALELAATEPLDLVLLDIMMPGMDGYEVTRRLKAGPQTGHIPIILVTALTGTEDKHRGLEAGADEFLNKPVNTHELLARVKSMIRLKQYQEQLGLRAESARRADAAARSRPPERTVLIVEDDERDARLMLSYLGETGARLLRADSQAAALALLEREPVDLVVLDLLLPDASGLELCRRIKRAEATRRAQVLMVTCVEDLETKVASLDGGADDYLIKPVHPKELLVRARALLRKKSYLDSLVSQCEDALASSVTDDLTGLHNRPYFMRFLESELRRATRQGYPVAVAMIDVDGFKRYNDSLGHLAGDAVLRGTAAAMGAALRDTDLLARFGGDEFALVMPYVGTREAERVVDRLCQAVRAAELTTGGSAPAVRATISAGVAVAAAGDGSAQGLLEAADQALYLAKAQGKDGYRIRGGATGLVTRHDLAANDLPGPAGPAHTATAR
ncbi:MAG: response regulator [Deltaproteobacteria bacterium]|nr:response regulator [Deltaproteobacteria bacterium]